MFCLTGQHRWGVTTAIMTAVVLFGGALVHAGHITGLGSFFVQIDFLRYSLEFLLYTDTDYLHPQSCQDYIDSLSNRQFIDRPLFDVFVLIMWFVVTSFVFYSILVYNVQTILGYSSQFAVGRIKSSKNTHMVDELDVPPLPASPSMNKILHSSHIQGNGNGQGRGAGTDLSTALDQHNYALFNLGKSQDGLGDSNGVPPNVPDTKLINQYSSVTSTTTLRSMLARRPHSRSFVGGSGQNDNVPSNGLGYTSASVGGHDARPGTHVIHASTHSNANVNANANTNVNVNIHGGNIRSGNVNTHTDPRTPNHTRRPTARSTITSTPALGHQIHQRKMTQLEHLQLQQQLDLQQQQFIQRRQLQQQQEKQRRHFIQESSRSTLPQLVPYSVHTEQSTMDTLDLPDPRFTQITDPRITDPRITDPRITGSTLAFPYLNRLGTTSGILQSGTVLVDPDALGITPTRGGGGATFTPFSMLSRPSALSFKGFPSFPSVPSGRSSAVFNAPKRHSINSAMSSVSHQQSRNGIGMGVGNHPHGQQGHSTMHTQQGSIVMDAVPEEKETTGGRHFPESSSLSNADALGMSTIIEKHESDMKNNNNNNENNDNDNTDNVNVNVNVNENDNSNMINNNDDRSVKSDKSNKTKRKSDNNNNNDRVISENLNVNTNINNIGSTVLNTSDSSFTRRMMEATGEAIAVNRNARNSQGNADNSYLFNNTTPGHSQYSSRTYRIGSENSNISSVPLLTPTNANFVPQTIIVNNPINNRIQKVNIADVPGFVFNGKYHTNQHSGQRSTMFTTYSDSQWLGLHNQQSTLQQDLIGSSGSASTLIRNEPELRMLQGTRKSSFLRGNIDPRFLAAQIHRIKV